jgi:hypothetical protein
MRFHPKSEVAGARFEVVVAHRLGRVEQLKRKGVLDACYPHGLSNLNHHLSEAHNWLSDFLTVPVFLCLLVCLYPRPTSLDSDLA